MNLLVSNYLTLRFFSAISPNWSAFYSMNHYSASACSSATFSFSATALSFANDLFGNLEELAFEFNFQLLLDDLLDLSCFSTSLNQLCTLSLKKETFWSMSSNYSSSVYWLWMFSSSSWISINILNISFNCCNSSLSVMKFLQEWIRLSVSLEFLITIDTNFDLLFSSKAILYSFPFSVSLTCLFACYSINDTAPISYASSCIASSNIFTDLELNIQKKHFFFLQWNFISAKKHKKEYKALKSTTNRQFFFQD